MARRVGQFTSTAALADGPSLRSMNLTASGLGFLAGYATHSFFGFLDNLIRTAFPSAPTPHPLVTSRPALSIGPVGMPSGSGRRSAEVPVAAKETEDREWN
jgi:hypothetical protein